MACKERYNPWLCFPNYLISAFCYFRLVFSLGKIWDRNLKVSQSIQYVELESVIWFMCLSSLWHCNWCWYLGTGVEEVICIFPPCQQCTLSSLKTWFLQVAEKGSLLGSWSDGVVCICLVVVEWSSHVKYLLCCHTHVKSLYLAA